MACSLVRAGSPGISRLPKIAAFCSDSLAILVAVTALASAGISRGADEPESVVLDFTASWCKPCQRMSPIVHKLQQQGYAIRKVDVDQHQNLARNYGITSIPTFVLIVDGREVTRVNGDISEEQLRRMAQQATPPAPAKIASTQPPRVSIPVSRREETEFAEDDETTFGEPPRASLGAPKSAADPEKKKGLFGIPKLAPLWGGKAKRELAERKRDSEPPTIRGKDADLDEAVELPVDNPLLAASVRLRVGDESGMNFGSGTIIDSRVGQTTILTCGHIFKPQARKSEDELPPAPPKTVEVDIFLPTGRHVTYVGKVVDYDLEADVGVVTITTTGALTSLPLAPLAQTQAVADELTSIGCGGGEKPTREGVTVTALNRYDGPDNVECTLAPQQGRSGGGLFDAQNRLVGVCIGADQKTDRGLYASLKPIHVLLQRAGLKQALPPEDLLAKADPEEAAAKPPATAGAFDDKDLAWLDTGAAPSVDEIAGMFEDAPDAEVICIVRPKNGEAQRVVIVNQASPKFMTYLLDSLDESRPAPRNTSFRVENLQR